MRMKLETMQKRELQCLDVPNIIENKNKHVSSKIKFIILERAGFQCEICGEQNRLTIDHKIPRSTIKNIFGKKKKEQTKKNGDLIDNINFSNYWILCADCHLWKNRTVDLIPHSQLLQ